MERGFQLESRMVWARFRVAFEVCCWFRARDMKVSISNTSDLGTDQKKHEYIFQSGFNAQLECEEDGDEKMGEEIRQRSQERDNIMPEKESESGQKEVSETRE
eukprot:1152324-Amorphochlora_amoeboformis.AAC.1